MRTAQDTIFTDTRYRTGLAPVSSNCTRLLSTSAARCPTASPGGAPSAAVTASTAARAESPRVWDRPARSLAAAAPGDDDLEDSFPGQEGRRRR
ncbi:MAG TPA: hypothetical protein VMK13_18025 [Streptosporangiaceae bacterium]|nr:hypothetical protein [Streptosporangiaceae bacterium]